ncbi:Pfs, NACHT and ankyrin domain protein [Xylaria grammica]|nr:Pfs, NACHT and ankyrin domain protein [Xylaria grammica]
MNQVAMVLSGLKGVPFRVWEDQGVWFRVLFLLASVCTGIYIHDTIRYHEAHHSTKHQISLPKQPSFVPYLSVAAQFLWNPRRAVIRFASFNSRPSISRLAFLPNLDIYLYQDPVSICQIWKQSSLIDLRLLASHILQRVCLMPSHAASLYRDDDSGVAAVPRPESRVPDTLRIHRMISESNHDGLIRNGLKPTIERYLNALPVKLATKVGEDWTEMGDFWHFIQDTVGISIIEAIFGPSLLQMHPEFVRGLVELDHLVPPLLKGVPNSKATNTSRVLFGQLKSWAKYAESHFAEESIYTDGDGDPFWGSSWTRSRHQHSLAAFEGDATTAHDLAIAWGSIAQVLPCTLVASSHVLKDRLLVRRIRQELVPDWNRGRPVECDSRQLSTSILLSSIYAETLRMHITAFIPVVPMHGNLHLGKWEIPKKSFGLISTGVLHKNPDIWNTKSGIHPVDAFWAERFIVDPSDPESGPINPRTVTIPVPERRKNDQPYFSLKGLEGVWVPYGGGQHMCPGRFLAKLIITSSVAILCSHYDVEFRKDPIAFGTGRFGLGPEHPLRETPFRIRRRKD